MSSTLFGNPATIGCILPLGCRLCVPPFRMVCLFDKDYCFLKLDNCIILFFSLSIKKSSLPPYGFALSHTVAFS